MSRFVTLGHSQVSGYVHLKCTNRVSTTVARNLLPVIQLVLQMPGDSNLIELQNAEIFCHLIDDEGSFEFSPT